MRHAGYVPWRVRRFHDSLTSFLTFDSCIDSVARHFPRGVTAVGVATFWELLTSATFANPLRGDRRETLFISIHPYTLGYTSMFNDNDNTPVAPSTTTPGSQGQAENRRKSTCPSWNMASSQRTEAVERAASQPTYSFRSVAPVCQGAADARYAACAKLRADRMAGGWLEAV